MLATHPRFVNRRDEEAVMRYTKAMTDGAVTILIPHFQTLEPVRLCLRSIRKYTTHPHRVRVLDNGSADASLPYLESVRWIELVQTGLNNDTWRSHYEALNRAVEKWIRPTFWSCTQTPTCGTRTG